jgi:ABC-2 type transport system ATP-binding protein
MQEVEEVCDRVAILCRGKLIALDSPLALRRQHHDRKVEIILLDGTRRSFDMDDEGERSILARYFAGGEVACAQTREFDFHQAFLKLTGTEFT